MADELQIPDSEAPQPSKPKKKVSLTAKLFAIFIIISMASWAVASYYGSQQDENSNGDGNNGDVSSFEVSGYDFYDLDDGTFATFVDVKGKEMPIAFRLDPRNASNITIDDNAIKEIFSANKIYLTTSPNQPDLAKVAIASAEIARIIPLYDIEVVAAYTEDSDPPNPNVPLKTCSDATNTTSVIYLSVGNETSITNNNGCITVSGKNADELILAADKLGYNLLGIKV